MKRMVQAEQKLPKITLEVSVHGYNNSTDINFKKTIKNNGVDNVVQEMAEKIAKELYKVF